MDWKGYKAAVAKMLLDGIKEDEASLIPSAVIDEKIDQVAKALFIQCHRGTSPVELIGRCVEPGKRELVYLKLAIRSAFEERPGEDIGNNYIRSYGSNFAYSIVNVAHTLTPIQLAEVLVELGVIKPAKKE